MAEYVKKKGFLGQDWSKDAIKAAYEKFKADPGAATLDNSAFMAGMGLLSSSYDSRINPFEAMTGGLQQARKGKRSTEDRKRIEELRKRLGELIRQQQQGAQGDPTTQQERAAQMSMIPGLPGSGVAPGGMVGGQQTPQPSPQDIMSMMRGGQQPGRAPGGVGQPGTPPIAPPQTPAPQMNADQAAEILKMQGVQNPSPQDIQRVMQLLQGQ